MEAIRDGRPVLLGGPRPRAVLGRLLVDAGRAVSTDALLEDVWNGRPPPTAAKTLQKYVSELRRALGDEAIRTVGRGYAVEAPGLDARRFEAHVGRAQADAAKADWPAALDAADQALRLWRGDVLAGLDDARFADAERSRLGELRLVALELRYGAAIELGQHGAAAADLAELVDRHPLREGFWALLMRALYGAGRQAEALRAFERHRRFLAEELGIEPSPKLRRLETAVLRHELPAATAPLGNLPHALSSFVGRAGAVDDVAGALGAYRLVTLTGPGGVGKTRLALEAAHGVQGGYPGGAWFVDLAAVTSEPGVHRALANALHVEDQPGQALLDTVATVLAHRGATLLWLDNCEHIAAACAQVAHAVLRRCPSVRVLATSRVPLGISGECVRVVDPLGEGEAVDLFVDRARLAAGFLAGPERRPVVAEICRRLDGLPLAIELAASQLRVLDPEALAARLDDRFALLQSPGTPAARQRTLLATVAWSYELLSPGGQDAFARLAVFPGSFTLEAAEAVGAGVACLAELVDHSLVVHERTGVQGGRYRLLDTIRLFAGQQLDARAGRDDAMRAHAEFVIALAHEARPNFYAPLEVAWRTRLQAEDHNLQAVMDWAVEHDPVVAHRLAVELWPYWDVRWQERYATAVLRRLLDEERREVPEEIRAWTLTAGADLAANTGDGRVAVSWADEAVAIFRRLGDRPGLTHAHLAQGSALGNRGVLDQAEDVLAAALSSSRALDDEALQARALQLLGFVRVRRGDLEHAAALHREELELWGRVGSVRGRATALRRLAAIERDRRRFAVAGDHCREALRCMEALDDAAGVAHVRLTLADLARLQGDDGQATALYAKALQEVLAIGDRRCTASTNKNLATMANGRGDHPSAARLFLESVIMRQELGDDAGVAECLEGLAATAAATGRQREAVVLLAAAAARREATGVLPHAQEEAELASQTGALRAAVAPAAFAAAWNEGTVLRTDEIVPYCHRVFGLDP